MKTDEVWAINNIAMHGVLNLNPEKNRIHLIADIYPDNRTLAVLLASDSPGAFWDPQLAALLMQDSKAPPYSIYAQGKPIPETAPAPESVEH